MAEKQEGKPRAKNWTEAETIYGAYCNRHKLLQTTIR